MEELERSLLWLSRALNKGMDLTMRTTLENYIMNKEIEEG